MKTKYILLILLLTNLGLQYAIGQQVPTVTIADYNKDQLDADRTVVDFPNYFGIPVDSDFSSLAVGAGSFNGEMEYDPNLLISQSPQNIDASISTVVGNMVTDELNNAWNASETEVTFDHDDLLFNLQFQYSVNNQFMGFKPGSVMPAYDTKPINGLYLNGSISENRSAATVCMVQVDGTIGAEVLMPVKVTGFTNIGAITLEFLFDPTQLDYIKIENLHSELSNGESIYNCVDNKLTYSWTVTPPNPPDIGTGITIADNGVLFNIKFKFKSGPAPVTFNTSICEISDYDIVVIPTTYCDGVIKSMIDVQIKAFLQGLYNTTSGEMNKAQDFVNGSLVDKFPGAVADEITVELHDATNYATIVHSITNVALNQDGTAQFQLPSTLNGSYYLTIKNRNHLETVSNNTINFASRNVEYDFSTDRSQSYGPLNLPEGNQIEVKTGVWGIYTGDVFQNGVIDINDSGPINKVIMDGSVGYLPEDIDGNGVIDINDVGHVNVNVIEGIGKITPP